MAPVEDMVVVTRTVDLATAGVVTVVHAARANDR